MGPLRQRHRYNRRARPLRSTPQLADIRPKGAPADAGLVSWSLPTGTTQCRPASSVKCRLYAAGRNTGSGPLASNIARRPARGPCGRRIGEQEVRFGAKGYPRADWVKPRLDNYRPFGGCRYLAACQISDLAGLGGDIFSAWLADYVFAGLT